MRERHQTIGTGAASLACTLLVAVACSAEHPPATGSRSNPSSAAAAAARTRILAARYLALATAGNRRLDADFDRLEGRDHDRLAAARADLHDAAATERLFDRRLLGIAFPPEIEATAHALVRVNETRATLTSDAAVSPTLGQLRRYEQQLSAANAAVEQQVRTLRSQLGLPPPETG